VDALCSALRSRCSPFLAVALGSGAGGAAPGAAGGAGAPFDFIGSALLSEAGTALERALPGSASVGSPAAFRRNHAASLRLLAELEALCTTRDQVSLGEAQGRGGGTVLHTSGVRAAATACELPERSPAVIQTSLRHPPSPRRWSS
jgi:hypothetical protein